MKAIWNNEIIAESNDTIVVEGNHYFPPEAVNKNMLTPSNHQSSCVWKGKASYYHIEAGGSTNNNAAWYYPSPMPAAANIKSYVAFWKGVQVVA